nr:G protein-coupled receptor [Proales similis]
MHVPTLNIGLLLLLLLVRQVVDARRCEFISLPMCRDLPYNQTVMPNQFNHVDQQEAAMEAHQFYALVQIGCSADIKFFLCSMYTPICLPDYERPVPACRSVCNRARQGCEGHMKRFGFEWPAFMSCDRFPEQGSEICMDPSEKRPTVPRLNINHQLQPPSAPVQQSDDGSCPAPFIKITDKMDSRYGKYSTGGVLNCLQPCRSAYFSGKQRQFAMNWLMIWALICATSSVFTVFTFMIGPSRFRYPERGIIYLVLCYVFISGGYLLRFRVGHDQMACEPDGSAIYSSTRNYCALSFALIYFFGMASAIWWCLISFTWFLAGVLKWSTESIANYGAYFHLIAWLLPFIKTLFVLTFSLNDADPLTGTCFVGNLNNQTLLSFVLIPSLVYLSTGISFLLIGFCSLLRLRTSIEANSRLKSDKLESLLVRIGIFAILYTVPCAVVIACQFYEYFYKLEWQRARLNCNEQCTQQEFEPEFIIAMLKHLMSLMAGIAASCWIFTGKTFSIWKRCLCPCGQQHRVEKILVSTHTSPGSEPRELYAYKPINLNMPGIYNQPFVAPRNCTYASSVASSAYQGASSSSKYSLPSASSHRV